MQYLGVDISKNKFDCCIFIDNKRKAKIFDNNRSGFIKLIEWFSKFKIDVLDLIVVMEATSIYHENLAYYLYSENIKVCVANPARVRKFAQGIAVLTKTDEVDAQVLVKYGELAKYTLWKPDSENLRLLKQLMLRRDAYSNELNREKNRLDQAKCNNTSLKIIEIICDDIVNLEKRIEFIDSSIDTVISDDMILKKNLQLLETIPAIGKRTALVMIILFSKNFISAGQAASFCGLIPVQRQSGSSVRGPSRISRNGSSKVRAKLYMAAVVAIRFNPHIKNVYDCLLSRGKAKMSALCAAMRKLVHIAFGVLKHQQPYRLNFVNSEENTC
ncbi:IS110 family transposase [Acinetobacter qingfengensis]|uniref:IS110 family transposase n=1 Tax=Acinetobacter qingfengensis TaxID=1262585 RepID=A0A1E7R6M2_9GAMM|nr:transposase [Acinetobacter qingfengensis]KAA8734676.1 IS110 family transposase [Acinetobacter qingfengensis]OEY94946.1 IS110 family transposase [Acinetobacter qingfengensis]